LKDGLEVLDGQKQSARGSLISYIDLSQGNKRAIVGLTSGAHAAAATQSANATAPSSNQTTPIRETLVATTRAGAAAAAVRNAETQTRSNRSDRASATGKKSDTPKKPDRQR